MKKFYNRELKSAGFPLSLRSAGMTESGRSMVEMLGVLAVIGVLSVAGIAGYKNAMNKHRANTLLNEASKRAVNVVAQISMMGKDADNASLSEFTDPTGYTFGVAKRNANQFNITIDSVSDDICAQMKATAGKDTPIRKINDTCTELTFNNDLSTTVYASDFETESACTGASKKWCSGWNTPACAEDCCAGVDTICNNCKADGTIRAKTGGECDLAGTTGYCNAGTCTAKPNCNTYTGTDAANTGGAVPNTECRCPAGSAWDTTNNTGCIPITGNESCTTQDDCGGTNSDYFCTYYMEGSIGSQGRCSNGERASRNGQCVEITTSNSGSNGDYVWTTKWMDWWTAENFCTAKGKNMPTIDSFQCYQNGTTNEITTGSSNAGYCCKEPNGPCRNNWTTNRATYFSAKIVDIKEKVNTTNNYWTSSPYGGNSTSCIVFGVGLYDGNTYNYYRQHINYALCE